VTAGSVNSDSRISQMWQQVQSTVTAGGTSCNWFSELIANIDHPCFEKIISTGFPGSETYSAPYISYIRSLTAWRW